MKRLIPLLCLCLAAPVVAQIPDKFENLQALPRDITRDSLVSTMRTITGSLGVRCQYCHVGGDTITLVGVDWKSDSLATKRRARDMIRLAADINTRLASTPSPRSTEITVDCFTCHRGLSRPEPLQAVLAQTIQAEGLPAAVRQYRELRERLLTRGRYDFGEASLNILAAQLTRQGRQPDAITILELNKEFHPELPTLNFQLAELYLARGDRDRAIALYRLVLEKQPQNQAARRRIDELTRR